MAQLTARVIEDEAGWQTLKADWDALLRASADSTPWQSWDYLTHWWRHMAGANRLRIVVVEADDRVRLVLPLQISTWSWLPGLPVRMLEPIGMPLDVNRPRFALGAPDADAWECAMNALWERRDEWHVIRIDEKADENSEIALLQRFAHRRGLAFRRSFSHPCPYLSLNQDWSAYLETRNSRLRKNLRAARRRLEARGAVSLRVYSTPAEIESGFGIFVALHERSWKHERRVEQSKSEAYRRFYGGWLRGMAARASARVLVLYCGDEPVAATIAFLDVATYYSAQIVYDAKFAACSPGTLLEALELEALMKERRFATYDFLGAFLSNKMRWTDTAIPTSHVFVMRPSARIRIVDTYYFRLKPYFKPRIAELVKRLRRY